MVPFLKSFNFLVAKSLILLFESVNESVIWHFDKSDTLNFDYVAVPPLFRAISMATNAITPSSNFFIIQLIS